MIKFCLKQWDKNKDYLENELRNSNELDSFEYLDLVKLIVINILNRDLTVSGYNEENITQIDNGDYQGTQLFMIPERTYQPSANEYLLTFIDYGSCSGCDTLLSIQSNTYDGSDNESVISDYMTLCKDIVCNIIKPYNNGWRQSEEFEVVEY